MHRILFSVGLSLMLITGCGGDGALSDAQGAQLGAYAIVDPASGQISYRATLAPAEILALRTSAIVLRRIPGGAHQLGANDPSLAVDADETARMVATRMCFVAVCETTTSQWQQLTQIGTGGDTVPQTGLRLAEVMASLATFSQRTGCQLVLPTDDEWETAARVGADGTDLGELPAGRSDLARTALVRESALASAIPVTGAQAVASREPTGLGFYDLIGNVWELVVSTRPDGLDANGQVHIRGGSWADPVATARVSNIVALDAQCAHPDVGFRLVLRP